ncbi:MAG: copper amine oxidase N-terminal domain-containing protein [Methanimicrococcus sp.]|nr:copper amine oxidase N-terminal domain-containing protein [Methanimicrococcus sp.]
MEVKIEDEGYPPYKFDDPQPYFDQTGATMFPMDYFNDLFKGNVSYEIENNTVIITKRVLDVRTVVSVTADSNILIRNGQEIEMNTMPVQLDGTFYIPLEYVGSALSYGVYWNDRRNVVSFHQYESVYVYVWNENEKSLPFGVRYSYMVSGDHTSDMTLITANPTSDYRKVRAVLKKLPKNDRVLTTKIYRVKGYDVPFFDIITDDIYYMGLISGSTAYHLDEIPPIIKDLREFTNQWYSQELFALDEEAIYSSEKQVYRYSYFPSFDDPAVVRIDIKNDGTADVHYKVGKGSTFWRSGGIKTYKQAKLNQSETQEFLDLINKTDFWNQPIEYGYPPLDGYRVIIEGVDDGEYYLVNRWGQGDGDPIQSIEEYFNELIEQKFE